MECPSPQPSTGVAPLTFASALQFFAAAQCAIPGHWPPEADVHDLEEVDFIIVGGGTAGCVVANRLSEVKGWTVLVIEAGPDPPLESRIPGLDLSLYGSKYDWGYSTVNDGRASQAYINGSSYWPRGKMLGGCSSINTMFYTKGVDKDYQRWYDYGNTDWHPDVVKKYFKKLESYQYGPLLQNPEIKKEYGTHGGQTVNRFNNTFKPVFDRVLDAFVEIGIKKVVDLNAAQSLGCGITAALAANGLRMDLATSFLTPIKTRRNLKVLKNTLVTKIMIGSSKQAYGVTAERDGKSISFRARKEVIICAGAIGTPQLLMLSGLGPKKHLSSKNIKCIVDLPHVGQNLRDHCLIPISIVAKDVIDAPNMAKQSYDTINYLYKRSDSTLSQNSVANIQAYYALNGTYPQIVHHLRLLPRGTPEALTRHLLTHAMKLKDSFVTDFVNINKGNTMFSFSVTLLHPYSKGYISLTSKNPKHKPLIHPNYLSDRRDMKKVIAGIRKLLQLTETKYFKSKRATVPDMMPVCNKCEMDSDDYWECYSLQTVTTLYHPVGTARMGRCAEDSVVNSKLKVHDVKNLRVIDASVMCTQITGNLVGPTAMIGERGADLVKEEYYEEYKQSGCKS